jgi:sulfoquinovose isomerase
LFQRAVGDGWDQHAGGFYYTLGWDGRPRVTDKIWWPLCEGIGAAVFLADNAEGPDYETWYRRIWDYLAGKAFEPRRERWIPQLDGSGAPKTTLFSGRPSHLPYHSLQACLIPLVPARGSLLAELSRARDRSLES